MRNYGDERILEFDRLAKDWEQASPQPEHPINHLRHAERYRCKAKEFRDHHEKDPLYRDRKDYPLIQVGKVYEARNHGVFRIDRLVPLDDPHRKEGFVFISTVGTYYTEGGRGTKSYDDHWSDLVNEVSLTKEIYLPETQ